MINLFTRLTFLTLLINFTEFLYLTFITYSNSSNPPIPSPIPLAPNPSAIVFGNTSRPSVPLPIPTDPIPNVQPSSDKVSNKRKNAQFECEKCKRTYLSYPALYMHRKLKHTEPQVKAGRISNRGRSKKNVG